MKMAESMKLNQSFELLVHMILVCHLSEIFYNLMGETNILSHSYIDTLQYCNRIFEKPHQLL